MTAPRPTAYSAAHALVTARPALAGVGITDGLGLAVSAA